MLDEQGRYSAPVRALYLFLGLMMVALGIIGAFLPVMPSTIFFIIAVWAFGRSSPRLQRWLLQHPRFGPSLRRWQDHGAISPASKKLACGGIAFGYLVFFISAQPAPWLALLVAAFMAACAIYIVSRPPGPSE